MRLRAALFIGSLFVGPAFAQETAPSAAPPRESPPPDRLAEARRHFRNGVKLYRDTNYAGALAEFEAAYALKPGPASLQNIALSQKALFRYGEAADSLKLLLERHGAELSENEQRAMRQAIEELESLVGSLLIQVEPSSARVTLNGQAVPPEQLGKRLRVNVGEHTIIAEAPGYTRVSRTFRVAGGQHDVPVVLTLEPSGGFVEIVAEDPRAVIAIDGKPLARGRWSGPVSPDEEHLVEVYREGFEPFERTFSVALGKTLLVVAPQGERLDDAELEPNADVNGEGDEELPLPPAAKPRLGWYALAHLSALGTNTAPLGFDLEGPGSSATGGALGVRGGYRFWRSIAAELVLEVSRLQADDACDPKLTADRGATCHASERVSRRYEVRSLRFGPNLRILSPGEKVRFVGGVGAGIALHELRLDELDDPKFPDAAGGKAAGVDPYFSLEAGVGVSLGRWLLEGVVLATIDGASSLSGNFDRRTTEAAFGGTDSTLPMLGLSLRFGYSNWRPR